MRVPLFCGRLPTPIFSVPHEQIQLLCDYCSDLFDETETDYLCNYTYKMT